MTEATDPARFFVCKAEDLADNQIRQVTPSDSEPVAIYKVGGEFFATDDTCTHGQAQLSDGEVSADGVVECPWHGGTFCVRTGKALDFPCVIPLKIYPVHVEEGNVYVNLAAGSTPE